MTMGDRRSEKVFHNSSGATTKDGDPSFWVRQNYNSPIKNPKPVPTWARGGVITKKNTMKNRLSLQRAKNNYSRDDHESTVNRTSSSSSGSGNSTIPESNDSCGMKITLALAPELIPDPRPSASAIVHASPTAASNMNNQNMNVITYNLNQNMQMQVVHQPVVNAVDHVNNQHIMANNYNPAVKNHAGEHQPQRAVAGRSRYSDMLMKKSSKETVNKGTSRFCETSRFSEQDIKSNLPHNKSGRPVNKTAAPARISIDDMMNEVKDSSKEKDLEKEARSSSKDIAKVAQSGDATALSNDVDKDEDSVPPLPSVVLNPEVVVRQASEDENDRQNNNNQKDDDSKEKAGKTTTNNAASVKKKRPIVEPTRQIFGKTLPRQTIEERTKNIPCAEDRLALSMEGPNVLFLSSSNSPSDHLRDDEGGSKKSTSGLPPSIPSPKSGRRRFNWASAEDSIDASGASIDPPQMNLRNSAGSNLRFQMTGLPAGGSSATLATGSSGFFNRSAFSGSGSREAYHDSREEALSSPTGSALGQLEHHHHNVEKRHAVFGKAPQRKESNQNSQYSEEIILEATSLKKTDDVDDKNDDHWALLREENRAKKEAWAHDEDYFSSYYGKQGSSAIGSWGKGSSSSAASSSWYGQNNSNGTKGSSYFANSTSKGKGNYSKSKGKSSSFGEKGGKSSGKGKGKKQAWAGEDDNYLLQQQKSWNTNYTSSNDWEWGAASHDLGKIDESVSSCHGSKAVPSEAIAQEEKFHAAKEGSKEPGKKKETHRGKRKNKHLKQNGGEEELGHENDDEKVGKGKGKRPPAQDKVNKKKNKMNENNRRGEQEEDVYAEIEDDGDEWTVVAGKKDKQQRKNKGQGKNSTKPGGVADKGTTEETKVEKSKQAGKGSKNEKGAAVALNMVSRHLGVRLDDDQKEKIRGALKE